MKKMARLEEGRTPIWLFNVKEHIDNFNLGCILSLYAFSKTIHNCIERQFPK